MFLQVRQLHKSFSADIILNDLNVDVEAHTTLSILGKSGCGKTTLLKMLAGLESVDAGTIRLGDRNITHLPPQQRSAVYLYQEPLLFPHLNAWDNVAFGLRLHRTQESDVKERVDEMIHRIGLTAHAQKMPDQLSGGQKQRVAFGRAIIVSPALLLLDEPFASLDAETRATMQQLFKDLSNQFRITSIFVTHDLKEALLMGDTIAHMQQGALKRYATKDEFIRDPRIGVMDEISFWSTLLHDNQAPESMHGRNK